MARSEFLINLKHKLFKGVITVLGALVCLSALYGVIAYHYNYSEGESVGYVQKLSYKGWICKTWEGEQVRTISTLPTPYEKFLFTVRDDAIAEQINQHLGQKVVLQYEQHIGLPRCWGETEHFIVGVKEPPP
jgi:hypothetical protein